MVEETRTKIREFFFEATGYLAEELLIQYQEHATHDVVYESSNSSKDLASYAAYMFINNLHGSEIQEVLGLPSQTGRTMQIYCLHNKVPKAHDLELTMSRVSHAIATR